MDFTLIVPAAGSGSRSGRQKPKQYVEILGSPVLTHTLRSFTSLEECKEIIIAIDGTWRREAEYAAVGIERLRFVDGGSERQESITNALSASDPAFPLVLVHDAARPCATTDLIERVLRATETFGAAIPVVPIHETVKRVAADGTIIETIPRDQLRAAQTPQGFQRDILMRAYANAAAHHIIATDDASLVEATGVVVHTVDGDWQNIKITIPADFARAEEIIRGRMG